MKWAYPKEGDIRWRRKFCWLPEFGTDGFEYWLETIWIKEVYGPGKIRLADGLYVDGLKWKEVHSGQLKIEWPKPRPNGPLIHESQAAKIAAGELNAAESIPVVMRRDEWVILLRALRGDPNIQPQLGRYAWRAISEIEYALSEKKSADLACEVCGAASTVFFRGSVEIENDGHWKKFVPENDRVLGFCEKHAKTALKGS